MLTTEQLLNAYSTGFFPMADEDDGEIWWHSPDPRAIIPISKLSAPRSVLQSIRKQNFQFKISQNFEAVVIACSNRDSTWINDEIIEAYIKLNREGWAHSVETYSDGELAGGLYGVVIGGAFFGESMFTIINNASKAAFFHLVSHLKKQGFALLDSQYINDHTKMLGAVEIPKYMYMKLLDFAINLNCNFVI